MLQSFYFDITKLCEICSNVNSGFHGINNEGHEFECVMFILDGSRPLVLSSMYWTKMVDYYNRLSVLMRKLFGSMVLCPL